MCCFFAGLDTETDKLIYMSLVHCPTMSKFILLSITKDNKPPPFLFFLNWEWWNDFSRIICFESNEVRLYTPLLSTVVSCQIHPPDDGTGFIGWHILFASLQRILIFPGWVYTQICIHKWSTIKWKLRVRYWGCESGIAALEVNTCFMIGLEATCIAGITNLLENLGRDILGSKETHTLTSLNLHFVHLLSKYLLY